MLRILPALLVIALIWVLSHPLGSLPAIGTMIDPVNGMMAAAEPVDKDFTASLKLTGIQAPVEVWFEDRLVPHVRAQNDHDLYFTQGFIHAYFRLWQMDMQTRAAGGRVSEVAGEKALEFDRGQRRKGMVYGAEKSLAAMEADPRTRYMLAAYRDGINAYIKTLNFRELPIEYKLMGFKPEQWTNLRSALLLKYMADDLTGKTDDIAFTLLRDQLGEEQFNYLFPERIQGSKPVIPEGTRFDPPSLKTPPVPAGEVWAHFPERVKEIGNRQSAISSRAGEGRIGSLQFAVCSESGVAPGEGEGPYPGLSLKGKGDCNSKVNPLKYPNLYAGALEAGTSDSMSPSTLRGEGRVGGPHPEGPCNAAANVRNGEKYTGDVVKHSRDGSVNVRGGVANVGDGEKHIGDAEKHAGDGVANVRGGEKCIGAGKKCTGDRSANVRRGVANTGDSKKCIGDGEKYTGDGSANIYGGSADFIAGADRDRCHPELVEEPALSLPKGRHLSCAAPPPLFMSWFDGAHHDMKRGAAIVGSSQFAVCSPASEVKATGAKCCEPSSNNPPTTLQQSSNGSVSPDDPDVAVGSNNWAVSGQHTASGKPILCNDPHLGLNLPSLWFEMQLSAPGINTYGVSLPGAPGIVIGYNDRISWGFTNNYRDVKDFYSIQPWIDGPKPDSIHMKGLWAGEYAFNNEARRFGHEFELIKVKGRADFIDTVLYTIHGPVMYDPTFPDPAKTGALLACTWMAHRGTNELLALYLVNRAGDYNAFTQAIQHFECPAQNFVYSDVTGTIAMWGQGRFINKWKGQGRFVMNGSDSSTLWGETIPMAENPHVLNPPQGYVASANQQVTDSTYPYWYNGNFVEWRSWEINDMIAADIEREDKKYNVESAEAMQNWTASKLWSDILQLAADRGITVPQPFKPHRYPPFLLADRPHATQFQIWWSRFYDGVWSDEFTRSGVRFPSTERTVQLMTADSGSVYFDDRRTAAPEGLRAVIQHAMNETMDSLGKLNAAGSVEWYQVKNTSLTHLAKLPAFSYDHLKIGGWGNTINAVSGNHGPSWRMIVEMDSIPKAYAIYPGGQSGNPGSRHYGDNVQQWVDGKYNELKFLTSGVKKNPFKYTWTISG